MDRVSTIEDDSLSTIEDNPWDGVDDDGGTSYIEPWDGRIPFCGPAHQWQMAKDPLLNDPRHRDWLFDEMMCLPQGWKGLLRLGYMNRIFFTIETNKDFVMRMVFRVFKKKLKYRWRVRYYAGFTIYHTLLVRALDALRLGPVVLDIASFLVRPNELLFFRRFIHRRSSREDIDAFLTERFRNIIL